MLPALLLVLGAFLPQDATAGAGEATVPAAGSDQRRSVLFWLIDTCRADHVSVYGHERRTTPFLERLAAEGVSFERCYSQAPWTKPSMASILTSQYPSRHTSTQFFSQLAPGFRTFPEDLKQAGWATVGFSANPVMGSFSNYQQGFDRFLDSWSMIEGNSPMDYASGSAARIVPFAVKWLDDDPPWPFFLYMHSLDPHEWYDPAPEFKAKFADPAGEPRFRAEWDVLMELHQQIVNTCTQATFDQAEIEVGPFIDYAQRLYDADLLANDTAIESLWRRLDDEAFRGRMIVLVTGDHGTEFMDHGATSLGHSLYQEMIHVPLILWAPGLLPAGLRFAEPVRSIDLYPTLMELLGLQAQEGLAGQSLVPWIEAGRATEARLVYAENVQEVTFSEIEHFQRYTNGDSYALLRWPWKLILNRVPRLGMKLPLHELYNLEQDPEETANLAAERPELVKELERELLVMQAAAAKGAPAPAAGPAPEVDPAALEALRALGYIGDDDDR